MSKRLLLLSFCVILSASLAACESPPGKLELHLYYVADARGKRTFDSISVFQITLRGSGIPNEGETTQFSPTVAGQKVLPNVRCNTEDRTKKIQVEIEVVGFSDENATRPSHSGRQVVFHECGRPLQVSLFISPIDDFAPLTAFSSDGGDVSRVSQSQERLAGHRVVSLPDGRLLITGGAEISSAGKFASVSNNTAIFDPRNGNFTDGPTMSTPRAFHSVTQVGDRVIVAGGVRLDSTRLEMVKSIDIFELKTDGTIERLDGGQLQEGRAFHSATITPQANNLLLFGGLKWNPQDGDRPVSAGSYEVFALDADLTPLNQGALTGTQSRGMHTANLLNNGKILIAGGFHIAASRAEALDSILEIRFKTADEKEIEVSVSGDKLRSKRAGHTATVVGGDQILLIGGMVPNENNAFVPEKVLTDIDLISETGGIVSDFNVKLQSPRVFHSTNRLADDRILVYGGLSANNRMNTKAELFQPSPTKGITGPSLAKDQNKSRFYHSGTVLLNGSLMLFGGATFEEAGKPDAFVTLDKGEVFNPGPAPSQSTD